MFTSKVKQRKIRNTVHNPVMGVGTSDNRCNEYFNIRGIYGEKVDWRFGSHLPQENCSCLF
jgi:hypothetical protein